MNMNAPSPPVAPLERAARWVVKDGVTLGNLNEGERSLALAWVWAGLPPHTVLNEPGVNAELKHQLQGAACWLDADHVELRRWLADGGWLARDGYGREYRRVSAADLPVHQQALGQALQGVDTQGIASQLRQQRGAARRAKHQAWQAGGRAAA